MKKITFLLILCCCVARPVSSQVDSIPEAGYSDIMGKNLKEIQEFKPDTTKAPDDKITEKNHRTSKSQRRIQYQ